MTERLSPVKRTRCKWPGCLRPATALAVHEWRSGSTSEPCCEECQPAIKQRAEALSAVVKFEPLPTQRSE